MPTLKKFLSSVEQKPSAIHGRGVCAKKTIKRGDYCSQCTQDIVNFVQETSALNSPLAPPWKDLLFADDDEDDSGGGKDAPLPLGECLEKFRIDFANYADRERSMANVTESVALSNDGRPSELHARVVADVKRGKELLRAYGPEWLSIKYYHLKANLHTYRTKLEGEGGGRRFMVFVDPTELLLQDATVWEDNELGMGAADGARVLSERAGREVRHVTIDELGRMANLLGMLAHEHFGRGDWKFDSSWKNAQAQLKQRK